MKFRKIQTAIQKQKLKQRKLNNMNPQKKAIGTFLKNKGTAIGVAVGASLVATGDYLLGDTGLFPWIIGVIKQIYAFF